ncbi:hypothetical protein CS0771_41410 [Catellatospora sp. IY07-71]|uniref:hypothetical protein n=1 Tax=Catellatospora sp. IY07-71 TaxID=2728827 RepID=UPI001BB391A2|nr:hypothetical protein [Catellatospora sp. IY07-71]BCJ74597.1 hypothetical protein CS0771_41410 [Catellatospora sp. IY07-71]
MSVGITVARRRASAWWYALPAGLLAITGFIWLIWQAYAPLSLTREARPLAGPADVVSFEMTPGVTYSVYQRHDSSRRGSDCRIEPERGEATGLGFGDFGRGSAALYVIPRAVTVDGVRYVLTSKLSNRFRRNVDVSCVGDPVLVEPVSERRIGPLIWLSGAALVIVGGFTAVLVARRRVHA